MCRSFNKGDIRFWIWWLLVKAQRMPRIDFAVDKQDTAALIVVATVVGIGIVNRISYAVAVKLSSEYFQALFSEKSSI